MFSVYEVLYPRAYFVLKTNLGDTPILKVKRWKARESKVAMEGRARTCVGVTGDLEL